MSLKQFNRQVLEDVSRSPLSTRDLIVEVLNKPHTKKSTLLSAMSKKPFVNLNKKEEMFKNYENQPFLKD